jgi:transcriptional regulator with XRE-family HTH domain
MDVKASFGENLKSYRKAKNLSQEQLSERADISVKHLSSIERGLTFVSADLLERLSTILETPAYLFFIKEAEVQYSDEMLNAIGKKVEERLAKAIEERKSDILKSTDSQETPCE